MHNKVFDVQCNHSNKLKNHSFPAILVHLYDFFLCFDVYNPLFNFSNHPRHKLYRSSCKDCYVTVNLRHDFYNIVYKIKHKLVL
jgi:hypothetical protein